MTLQDKPEWVQMPASGSDLTDLIPSLASDITTHSLSQHERRETGSLTLQLKAIVTPLTSILNVGIFLFQFKEKKVRGNESIQLLSDAQTKTTARPWKGRGAEVHSGCLFEDHRLGLGCAAPSVGSQPPPRTPQPLQCLPAGEAPPRSAGTMGWGGGRCG